MIADIYFYIQELIFGRLVQENHSFKKIHPVTEGVLFWGIEESTDHAHTRNAKKN
jgi:hypothetical protein